MTEESEFKQYGESEFGNFKVINKIGVPHSYCLTPRHISVASDEFGGMLTESVIRSAEEEGAVCDICKNLVREGKQDNILSFDEHKQALVVECKKDVKTDKEAQKEINEWLLKNKNLALKNNIEGFAFVLNKL